MPKWDYMVVLPDDIDKRTPIEKWLKKVGEEGWELVAIGPLQDYTQVMYLKRLVPGEQQPAS